MMPRIEAGERLAAQTDAAIAAGSLSKHDAGRVIRRLEDVQRGTPRKPARATPAVLAGMGIAVVSAPSKKAPSDG